jgi:hypothetical protein
MGFTSAAVGLRWLDDLGRDTRYAVRTWRRQPAVAIVCRHRRRDVRVQRRRRPDPAAAFAVARLLSGLLFGIGAADPAAIAAVAAVFILSAAAAMYFPARRASRIDPLAALRSD